MATSGTVAFTLDVVDLIEDAFEMVGKEVRGGHDMKTARRSLDLLTKEWGNRGLNFWTIESVSVSVPSGTASLTIGDGTIDVIEAIWRTGTGSEQYDRILTRFGTSDWAAIANKNLQSTVSNYWINRTDPPVLHLWPQPAAEGTLVYYRLRQMDDAGAYTNNMDVPVRFLPALSSGLAYYLAIKTPGAEGRIPILQAEYERQFKLAAEEDRDKVSLRLIPRRRRR